MENEVWDGMEELFVALISELVPLPKEKAMLCQPASIFSLHHLPQSQNKFYMCLSPNL